VRITYWGTRGSIASAGVGTVGYGGNTSCVQVTARDGTTIVLDAGTGMRPLGAALPEDTKRIDVLLSHLHMDHIQGLGFFVPLFRPDLEVHIWGPPSATMELRARLNRYLSPPLFPVRLREVTARVHLHNAPETPVAIGPFEVVAAPVIHPGPTVGYRIHERDASMAYLPDHEPALGADLATVDPRWVSGYDLVAGVNVLVHDSQYLPDERAVRVGYGHTSSTELVAFARLTGVRRVVAFHHDPAHDDATVDRLVGEVAAGLPGVTVAGAREGDSLDV
jgi:phosphoribosyl 1,2-cyclic phosphodiesterase